MNRAIKTIVATLGLIFGFGSMNHGFFETLQGNTATEGVIINAISMSRRTWEYGGESAFTLIPNFLVTGLAAMFVGVVIMVWSARYLDTKHGATVFLSLFILSFLVGGGIGQIVFFTMGWVFATRINKPLTWWRKVLPEATRTYLTPIWRYALVLATVMVLLALEIAVFGYFPGVAEADQLMSIMIGALGIAILSFILSFVSAVAYDINARANRLATHPIF